MKKLFINRKTSSGVMLFEMLTKLLSVFVLLFVVAFSSCKKFLDVEVPKSKITNEMVFTSDVTATSAMTGVYVEMLSADNFARGDNKSVVSIAGLSSDELLNYPRVSTFVQFEQNALTPDNAQVLTLWSSMYKTIYMANSVLEGVAASTTITEPVKKQLEGEAKFVRAFCHFYLINLFGDVPLVLTTDYSQNSLATRTPAATVYQQIVNDLLSAQANMGDTYVGGANERARPNKATATALLARVYLYLGDWVNAETQASSIISNTAQYGLVANLDNVFLKDTVNKRNTEAIWQLRPLSTSINTLEGNIFIINTTSHQFQVLNNSLNNGFEVGDQRKVKWISSFNTPSGLLYFPFKYKLKTGSTPISEYSMVFRLAEQYLIRAEARTQLGNLSNAIKDVDSIRKRASLPLIVNTNPGISQANLLLAIEQERKAELFCEWGHRWLDLKRRNRATAVLGPIKIGWIVDDMLYPLPQAEMNKNPNLRPQNPGY